MYNMPVFYFSKIARLKYGRVITAKVMMMDVTITLDYCFPKGGGSNLNCLHKTILDVSTVSSMEQEERIGDITRQCPSAHSGLQCQSWKPSVIMSLFFIYFK